MKSPQFCSLLLILILSSCITIDVMPARKLDDGYSKLSEEEQNKISDFQLEEVHSPNKFTIQHINGGQFLNLSENNTFTWATLWATWCVQCIDQLPNYLAKADKFKDSGLRLVLICSNYDLKNIERHLSRINFSGTVYVLENDINPDSQSGKIKKFVSDICPDCESNSTALPKHFVFKGKKILYQKEGRISEAILDSLVVNKNL